MTITTTIEALKGSVETKKKCIYIYKYNFPNIETINTIVHALRESREREKKKLFYFPFL